MMSSIMSITSIVQMCDALVNRYIIKLCLMLLAVAQCISIPQCKCNKQPPYRYGLTRLHAGDIYWIQKSFETVSLLDRMVVMAY